MKSHQLFDPAITQAKLHAQQIQEITPEYIMENGGQQMTQWQFSLTDEAHLETLKRLVKKEHLGTVFADGTVFDAIEPRDITVTFFKFDDNTGVAVAEFSNNSKAIDALLKKITDPQAQLDLAPKAPVPLAIREAQQPQAPTEGSINLPDGSQMKVQFAQPTPKAPNPADFAPIPREAMAGQMPMMFNPSNPIAFKTFLKGLFTQPRMVTNASQFEHLAVMSLIPLGEVHPSDERFPEGIRAKMVLDNQWVECPSPKALMAQFNTTALNKAPAMNEQDITDAFKARKNKM